MVLLCREDLINDAPAPACSVRVQFDRSGSGVERSPSGRAVHPELTSLGGLGTKHLLQKFVPLCVGMTCLGSTGMVLFQCSSALATPGSANARVMTSNTLLAVAKVDTDPVSNPLFPPGMFPANTLSPIESLSVAPHFSHGAILNGQEAVEQYFWPNLSSEIYWQAQNPTVTPAPNPGITPSNVRPNPNEDRFLQPLPNPTPQPLEPQTPPTLEQPPSNSEPPSQSPPTSSDAPTVPVKKIEVIGSSVFSPEQFNPIVQPYEGRSLSVEQLRAVADAITQLYLERGYITSRAILVDQEIANGVVQIRVIEGSLAEIQIEGTRRVNPDYVRSRVQLGAKTPLNTAKLEDQLRLLRADPLFENVEASLRATGRTGQSILIVRVTEADPFEGSVGIDNYSPPSVGSERLGLNLLYRNLTGYGDQVATSYYHTTRSGSDNLELSYQLPVNPMNGTVQLRTALTWNKIVDSEVKLSDLFNIEGNSQLYEGSFRQPLIRTPREEFALSLGFAWQRNQTQIGDFGFPSPGADVDGVTQTSVLKFGQDYVRRDVRGAWSLRSLFSFGLGIFDATVNPSPEPDGRFFSWLAQAQRVQILNENNFLIVGADIQLTPDSLLPSQQFVVGGGQSLRGYRQNIRAGDNGVRFSLEDRITLERNEAGAATFQLAPFFDAGYVWNSPDNPINQFLPSQRFLAGLGIGLLWEPQPGLNLRLDYGYPLIKLDDRGENAQDRGFYFSVRYQF
jgi:hemolysin activation/secretion protein